MSELTPEQILAETQDMISMYRDGQYEGIDQGRAEAAADLRPYVQHIGNCGAIGSNEPTDSRCICGLRQVWTAVS